MFLSLEVLECFLAGKLGSVEVGMPLSYNQEHVYLAGSAGARGDRRGVLEGQIEFTTRFARDAEVAEGNNCWEIIGLGVWNGYRVDPKVA